VAAHSALYEDTHATTLNAHVLRVTRHTDNHAAPPHLGRRPRSFTAIRLQTPLYTTASHDLDQHPSQSPGPRPTSRDLSQPVLTSDFTAPYIPQERKPRPSPRPLSQLGSSAQHDLSSDFRVYSSLNFYTIFLYFSSQPLLVFYPDSHQSLRLGRSSCCFFKAATAQLCAPLPDDLCPHAQRGLRG